MKEVKYEFNIKGVSLTDLEIQADNKIKEFTLREPTHVTLEVDHYSHQYDADVTAWFTG